MESTIFFKTSSNNTYLYDTNKSIFLLINPLIEYFYQLEKMNINIEENKTTVKIEGKKKYSLFEIKQNLEKYNFLKTNGFFSVIKNKQRTISEIHPDSIKFFAANIKQIVFEVTENCNLNCTYCAYNGLYSDSSNRTHCSLSLASAKSVIDYFSLIWQSNKNINSSQNVIISFYGGEPLLKFDFITMLIDYISKKKIKSKSFNYSITTNGILLNKYIDYLVNQDFMITVSLDGNFGNNQYRIDNNNNNPHRKIVRNLKEIMKKYPQFYETNISFNTVLHDKNSIDSVYNFFTKELNKSTRFLEMTSTGVNPDKKQEFIKMSNSFNNSYLKAKSKEYIKNSDEWNLKSDSIILTMLRGCWAHYIRTYTDLYSDKAEQEKLITATCQPLWKKMFVTSKGFILPCEKISHIYSIGKIINNNVEINFNEIAEQYNRYYNKIFAQCDNCYLSRMCQQCMFQIDSFDKENPQCSNFSDKKKFVSYLSHIYSMIETEPKKVFSLLNETFYE